MREALIAALRRDPEILPKVAGSLRGKIDEGDGRMATVVQAAEALEPVIADAVRKRPSRLGKLGLKSATLLASLATEDTRSNRRLEAIARGSIVGIVFVDIAGFTTFTAERGDEAAIQVLERVEAMIDRKMRVARGECVKGLGDGFLLAFPSASQAVRGGLAIREGARRERARDGRFPLQLRIAVHAGEPLIEADDLLGHDVNLTARLLEHCKPGNVVVSEAARELAERRLKSVRFGRRKTVKVRGLTMKVPIYTAEPAPLAANGRVARRPRARRSLS